jgi:YHS domain-containing protein
MGWLIRILLLLLLVMLVGRLLWRFIVGVADGASGETPRRKAGVPGRGTQMVRDPVCGTFVVQSRALSAASGGETAFFCSEECRREWRGQHG